MKLLRILLSFTKKKGAKTLSEYQRETMVKLGSQQFKKLNDLGLVIPVRLA